MPSTPNSRQNRVAIPLVVYFVVTATISLILIVWINDSFRDWLPLSVRYERALPTVLPGIIANACGIVAALAYFLAERQFRRAS
jgi:hypothetical protein